MKRGVRGVTKSLRTLSTIYVFCEDLPWHLIKVAGLFFDKFTFTHSQASLLSMCTHPVESSQK